MTNNINIDLKSSDIVKGFVFKELILLVPFLLLFFPALFFGFWMFGNLTQSLDREKEFNLRVQQCTALQFQQYGRVDSQACKKSVNATYRVYSNL